MYAVDVAGNAEEEIQVSLEPFAVGGVLLEDTYVVVGVGLHNWYKLE